jgi:hypothetical protein
VNSERRLVGAANRTIAPPACEAESAIPACSFFGLAGFFRGRTTDVWRLRPACHSLRCNPLQNSDFEGAV